MHQYSLAHLCIIPVTSYQLLVKTVLFISHPLCPFSYSIKGFPGGSLVKYLPANAGDMGLIRGSGRSPGGGNGNPLQYSCLGNPVYRGA